MLNPFNYSGVASDGHFCKRDKETTQLKTYMQNGAKIVLFSKRRYGKTSLILDMFDNHIDKTKYLCIYFDIFGIQTPQDFAKLFYKAVAKSLKMDFKTALTTLKGLFSRANFSASVSESGEIEFKPTVTARDFDELLEDIFENLSSYLKRHDMRAIVAIDEFQRLADIKEKNMEALLRTHIQKLQNVSFIYCGSKQHMLTQMFASYSRPFYAQATMMELPPIDKDSFYEFANEKFIFCGKSFDKEAFYLLYALTDGESWLIQNACYHLWQNYEHVTAQEVKTQIKEIVLMSDNIYKSLLDIMPTAQKIAIKIVAEHGTGNIYQGALLTDYSITKSSLQTAINSLLEKDVITKNEDGYYVCDKQFELWLKFSVV